MAKTIGDNIIEFNKNLEFNSKLPLNVEVLNPFKSNPEIMDVMFKFYDKYYSDNNMRKFIIGINPGRHGAGTTGVPFTDTKRMKSVCGIDIKSNYTHEVSSVFIYDMIEAYGGADKFFKEFYINSPFPLSIIRKNNKNSWVNANYYDDNKLYKDVEKFMLECLNKQFSFGIERSKVYILGVKNAKFIDKMNKQINLFDSFEVLEHPRYIQQYKSKERDFFIDKYIRILSGLDENE